MISKWVHPVRIPEEVDPILVEHVSHQLLDARLCSDSCFNNTLGTTVVLKQVVQASQLPRLVMLLGSLVQANFDDVLLLIEKQLPAWWW